MRDLGYLTHGQVIEALAADRLSSPAPLVRVAGWAREHAVEEVFGIDPPLLNGDRIGRALDAIAPELDHIVGSVGAQAISVFGLGTSRLHWDMTSISLYGAYDQVDAGLAVTGDSGIPVFRRAYDGGAAEVAQVVGAMIDAGTGFVAPAAKADTPAALDLEAATEVGYVAERDMAKPAADRGRWHVTGTP